MNYSPLLPNVQWLKMVISFFCLLFHFVSGGGVNLLPSTPSWLDVEVGSVVLIYIWFCICAHFKKYYPKAIIIINIF